MSQIPGDLRYSADHLWVRPDSTQSLAQVGITDYAQDSLGDVVNITLPAVGEALMAGQAFGEIESTKSINDLISPLDGTVHTRNDRRPIPPNWSTPTPMGRDGYCSSTSLHPP